MPMPKIIEKPLQKHECTICDFICSKHSNLIAHLSTRKHGMKSGMIPYDTPKNATAGSSRSSTCTYACVCGAEYKHRQNLSRHRRKCHQKKQDASCTEKQQLEGNVNVIDISSGELIEVKCSSESAITSKPNNHNHNHNHNHNSFSNSQNSVIEGGYGGLGISNELVVEIIKENKELRKMLVEQNSKVLEIAKEGKYITTTNNSTTTNTFNLNIFLNEKCKNALNIMDFVNSLDVEVQDLEETARVGYSEGISKILIRGLRKLDICRRPIHCSDLKRETLYIKDNDIWAKEDKDKSKLKSAIHVVGGKNISQISKWVAKNPEYQDYHSMQNTNYLKLLSNAMVGGSVEETNQNIHKVILNVTKESVIDKSVFLV